MKTLIIFDSYFGNTAQIGHAIAASFPQHEVEVKQINEVGEVDWKGVNLLILGSPTRGFKPTEKVLSFLEQKYLLGLPHLNAAVFDTRIALDSIKSKFFRFIVNTGGYAAPSMARLLKKHDVRLIGQPMGFYVSGEQGPLVEGESERAAEWGKTLLEQCMPD
jgi:flavodoxin